MHFKEKGHSHLFLSKNFTSECTKEACEFRDSYQDFKDLGAEVIAISADSGASHSRFITKFNLPFIFFPILTKKPERPLVYNLPFWARAGKGNIYFR